MPSSASAPSSPRNIVRPLTVIAAWMSGRRYSTGTALQAGSAVPHATCAVTRIERVKGTRMLEIQLLAAPPFPNHLVDQGQPSSRSIPQVSGPAMCRGRAPHGSPLLALVA